MNRTVIVVFLALILSIGSPLAGAFQVTPQPMGKQEIVALLKKTDSRRLSQAEIADEIDRRGIAFVVDEKVLREFQTLGAKAFLLDVLKRATKGPVTPQVSTAKANSEELDDEARVKAEAEEVAKLPLLEQAKRKALVYDKELPDFITTQIVKRYIRTAEQKEWQLEDTLEIELTYTDKGEQFKVLKVNGKPSNQSYKEVGGSTSTGEFGSLLASLFLPQTKTEFREVKKELFNGKPTVVYDYTVKKANSNSSISDRSSGKTIIAGYSGSIWIDTESKRVLRVESMNEGIPADFPITLSENAVEYDWVKIEGTPYLMPVRAEMILGRDRDRFYTRNVIEFRNYKKFEASIKIQDDKGGE